MGLLEVMKLFTQSARSAGTVREILAKDGEMVEFDQPSFSSNRCLMRRYR